MSLWIKVLLKWTCERKMRRGSWNKEWQGVLSIYGLICTAILSNVFIRQLWMCTVCITCHLFHTTTEQYSNLPLYTVLVTQGRQQQQSASHLCRDSVHPGWSRDCSALFGPRQTGPLFGWTGYESGGWGCWRSWGPQARWAHRHYWQRSERSEEGKGIRQSGWCTSCPLYRRQTKWHIHQYLRRECMEK